MGTRATRKLRFTSGHEVMAYLGRQYFSDYPYEGAHKLSTYLDLARSTGSDKLGQCYCDGWGLERWPDMTISMVNRAKKMSKR